MKSEYELLREKKIQRNQSRLLELGLVKPGKQAPKRKASPAVKKKITKKTLPIRRSARQISIKYPSFKVGDSSGDSGSDASISDADSNSSDVMASKQRNEKKKTKPQIWQLARWNGQVIVNMTPQELRKKIRDADESDFDKMSNSSQRAILIRLGLSSKGSLKAALESKILLVKNGKEDQGNEFDDIICLTHLFCSICLINVFFSKFLKVIYSTLIWIHLRLGRKGTRRTMITHSKKKFKKLFVVKEVLLLSSFITF